MKNSLKIRKKRFGLTGEKFETPAAFSHTRRRAHRGGQKPDNRFVAIDFQRLSAEEIAQSVLSARLNDLLRSIRSIEAEPNRRGTPAL